MGSSSIEAHVKKHYSSFFVQHAAQPQPGDCHGRGLVARQPFQMGEEIFREQPLIHTSEAGGQHVKPDQQSGLPIDWQRLLHIYASRRLQHENEEALDHLLHSLSRASVTSACSKAVDPTKAADYEENAKRWIKKWKETKKKREARQRKRHAPLSVVVAAEKKEKIAEEEALLVVEEETVELEGGGAATKRAQASWSPTRDEIVHLLAALDTNSHSRDEKDEMDLQHPLQQAPGTAAAGETAQEEESPLFGAAQDEACGVWLVASMLNHACLPNCTVDIPSPLRSEAMQLPYPTLLVRCVRPIAAGEELLISYHDEELMPVADRQALLLAKGFACGCVLCKGIVTDKSRAAICPHCEGGLCIPLPASPKEHTTKAEVGWQCDRCGQMADRKCGAEMAKREETWMQDWGNGILKMVMQQPHRPFMGAHLLEAMQSLPPLHTAAPETVLAQLAKAMGTKMAPMSVTHGYVYAFLKFILFEQSVWLRGRYGMAGIDAALLTMLAIVERTVEHVESSDEYRKLHFWVAKQASAHLEQMGNQEEEEQEEEQKWRQLRDTACHRWETGMKILYGYTP